MKVLHVIPSVAVADGGPARAVVQMVRTLQAQGLTAEIATTDDGFTGAGASTSTSPHAPQQHQGCTTRFFPLQTRFYKISLPLMHWLNQHAADYDIVHIHALFSFAPWAAAQAARRAQVPYIARPLGVLNRYGMEQRRPWLKALSFRLLDRPLLNGAAAIHYTSAQESGEAARLGLTSPPAVIPLGIDISSFTHLPPPAEFQSQWPITQGRRLVLFLSRIDAKKGLDLLLPAFAKVKASHPDAMLVIAGDGSTELKAQLQATALQLGIGNDVLWTGFLEGSTKLSALAAAEVFVLPSRSENFGIALLEAMAAGCACVATPGVALGHDAPPDSLLQVEGSIDPLAHGIARLLSDLPMATQLRAAARHSAFQHFSAEGAGRQLAALYQRILSTGPTV